VATGCTGSIGDFIGRPTDSDPATAGGGTGDQGNGDQGSAQAACKPDLGFAPPRLWRLNDEQYANVVHDVFGSSITVPSGVSEGVSTGAEELERADSLLIASDTTARNYMDSAHTTAVSAVAQLDALLGCAATTAGCVETFIKTKVARAFRRPIADAEVADMRALYDLGAAGATGGAAEGMRVLLEYVLQSPAFLWRTELAGADPAHPASSPQPLGPFELAGSMSFLFLNSAPDDGLWSKATAGTLAMPEVLSAEVDRLMGMTEVKANLARKIGSWLMVTKTEGTAKDPKFFPEFTTEVRDALSQSVKMFVQDVVLNGNLSDLVSSHKMFLNQELAALYGVSGVTGASLVAVDMKQPQWGAGILSQPAILAANSRADKGDPIHRGLFVYSSMVCGQAIGSPPADAFSIDHALPADATERERATFRASNSKCSPCHSRFDPFGLVTERYDPIGRYHETNASGKPIDQSATIRVGNSLDGPIDGVGELVTRMQSLRDFPDCASAKIAALAVGRTLAEDNSCALRDLQDGFAKTGSFTGLFKGIATSPTFLTRDARLQ
jgi:hypothetical protein